MHRERRDENHTTRIDALARGALGGRGVVIVMACRIGWETSAGLLRWRRMAVRVRPRLNVPDRRLRMTVEQTPVEGASERRDGRHQDDQACADEPHQHS